MVAALSELAGINEEDIEVNLDRDAFTLSYDASKVTLEDMYQVITNLGYSPGLKPSDTSDSQVNSDASASPIDSALITAAKEGKLVLVDFSAEWCAACKVLESQVLSDPAVMEALNNYIFVNLDTDTYPDATSAYEVVGMPTLVIVDAEGGELFRSVGMIKPEELTQKLNELAVK